MTLTLPVLLVVACILCGGSARADSHFLAGADFSDLAFFESQGVAYKDGGQIQDGLQILKKHGLNCVRLRLFTSSAAQAKADPYNYINNTDYTMPLAVRVKKAGLLFLLDFHYSDTWADPSHQATPAAWADLDFPRLVQQMRAYNSNTIAGFAAAGAMPDYVQVGNEITPGMLWPIGQVSGNGGASWSRLGQLMKAAVQGIQDAAGAHMPQIIIHIDRGGDWAGTKWFFDNLITQSVPFDIIGESYYPFFHGTPESLSSCLNNAAARYGKPIIVAEDAFPWTNTCPKDWTNKLCGFAPTAEGQVSFIAALARIVEGVTNHLGAGFFYWGAEYQSIRGVHEAGYNTSSFFDFRGNVLPVADAVGGMDAPLSIRACFDGSNLRLQWPFSGAYCKLMVSSSPTPSAIWSFVTGSIQTTDAVFTVTLPIGSNACYYRLQPE